MKRHTAILSVLLLAFSTVFFIQCGPKGNDQTASVIEETEQDKRKLADDLYQLSANIERKIEEVNRNLSDATDEARIGLEEIREALIVQKLDAERAIYEIENATSETWEEVRSNSLAVYNEVRISFQDLGNQMSALFESNEEEIE
jgi:hypothetical protein